MSALDLTARTSMTTALDLSKSHYTRALQQLANLKRVRPVKFGDVFDANKRKACHPDGLQY